VRIVLQGVPVLLLDRVRRAPCALHRVVLVINVCRKDTLRTPLRTLREGACPADLLGAALRQRRQDLRRLEPEPHRALHPQRADHPADPEGRADPSHHPHQHVHRAAPRTSRHGHSRGLGMATRQELRGADHRRRGRTTASRRAGTAARSPRPRRHRPDPDRHARPGEAVQPLPPVLQPSRLRPPVPAPGTRRTAVRPRATLAIPRQDPRPRRLHRRPSHRSHRTDHPRQLPAPRTPLPPDPAGPEDQRTRHHHQRRHRSRTEHPGHRCHLTPPRSDRRTPPFSRRSHTPRAAQKSVQYSCRGSYRTSHNRDTNLWTPWHPWLSTFLGRASRTRRGRAGRGGEPIEGVTMSTTTAIPVSLVLPHITLTGHIRHDRGAGTLDLLDEEGVERLSTDLSVYGCVAGMGEVFIKDWSEHAGLADALAIAGVVSPVESLRVG